MPHHPLVYKICVSNHTVISIAFATDEGHTPCDKKKEANYLRAQAAVCTTVAKFRKGKSSLL